MCPISRRCATSVHFGIAMYKELCYNLTNVDKGESLWLI